MRKRQKMRREGERRDVFERYIGEIAKALNAITGEDARKIYDALLQQARTKTAVADQELDEDGKVVADDDDSFDDDGVIVVSSAIAPIEKEAPLAAPVFLEAKSKSTKPVDTKRDAKAVAPSTPKLPPSKRSAPAIITKKDLAARASEAKPTEKKPRFDDNDPRLF